MSDEMILILGLGNPILGDDGVGWKVAEQIREQISEFESASNQVEVDCLAVGGLSLMERLVGYDRAILVDAIATGVHPAGTVVCIKLNELPNRAWGHLSSAHDTTLQNALEMGRSMGAKLPNDITIVGIEAQLTFDFSEDLSPHVKKAVSDAVVKVLDLIKESSSDSQSR